MHDLFVRRSIPFPGGNVVPRGHCSQVLHLRVRPTIFPRRTNHDGTDQLTRFCLRLTFCYSKTCFAFFLGSGLRSQPGQVDHDLGCIWAVRWAQTNVGVQGLRFAIPAVCIVVSSVTCSERVFTSQKKEHKSGFGSARSCILWDYLTCTPQSETIFAHQTDRLSSRSTSK